jgi:hypothetical protein
VSVDLDLAERVINRPHVIDLREDGWSIMHPPACHPRLFDCPVGWAFNGTADPGLRGQYECWLTLGDVFEIGEPVEDAPGIDWAALVAELRAARLLLDLERPLSRPHCSPSCPCERNQAWLAYEQAVAP